MLDRYMILIFVIGIAGMGIFGYLASEGNFEDALIILIEILIFISTIIILKIYIKKSTKIKVLPKTQRVTRNVFSEGKAEKQVIYRLPEFTNREFKSRIEAFNFWRKKQ